MLLTWIIGFCVLGSVGAVAGAGAMLLFPEAVRRRIVPALVSYATGTLLGAAFLTAIPLGVATAFAVIAHEIPQEVGDFGILLDSGYGRGKALLLNTLSSLATLPGGIAAYLWLDRVREAVPFILAVSAASFIYIATADLIPALHRQVAAGAALRQLALLLAGIATIAVFHPGG